MSVDLTTGDDVTTNLLKGLLFGAKDTGEAEDSNVDELKGGVIGQLPDNITRLNSTATAEAAPIVKDSCKTIQGLRETVALLAMKDRVNATARDLRIHVAADATQAIHLMQKFHRFDHRPQLARALAPLKNMCEMNAHFGRLGIETSLILSSLNRKPQVRKLQGLLEKRLLAMNAPRPEWFRGMIQKYSETQV